MNSHHRSTNLFEQHLILELHLRRIQHINLVAADAVVGFFKAQDSAVTSYTLGAFFIVIPPPAHLNIVKSMQSSVKVTPQSKLLPHTTLYRNNSCNTLYQTYQIIQQYKLFQLVASIAIETWLSLYWLFH